MIHPATNGCNAEKRETITPPTPVAAARNYLKLRKLLPTASNIVDGLGPAKSNSKAHNSSTKKKTSCNLALDWQCHPGRYDLQFQRNIRTRTEESRNPKDQQDRTLALNHSLRKTPHGTSPAIHIQGLLPNSKAARCQQWQLGRNEKTEQDATSWIPN